MKSLDLDVNHSLSDLEEALAALFLREGGDLVQGKYLRKAVQALTRHGCDSYLYQLRKQEKSTEIEVLSLDIASLGAWSNEGSQVCTWATPNEKLRGANGWYKQALDLYFAPPNACSLLSLTYGKKAFASVHRLNSASPSKTEKTRFRSPSTYECWRGSFELKSEGPTVGQSKDRFDLYRQLLYDQLEKEFGPGGPQNALLAWVYVSSGPGIRNSGSPSTKGRPPMWAASDELNTKNIAILVSNLLNVLRTAAHRTLGSKEEMQNLGQVLAHEFKNLNQEVAILADGARNDVFALPLSVRNAAPAVLARCENTLNNLALAAQATTALCKGAHWLFSTDKKKPNLQPDPECRVFRQILFLAIRLLAPGHPKWKLEEIPEMKAIVCFFRDTYARQDFDSPNDLIRESSIAAMLFLTLEPVRNMRARERKSSEITISVETKAPFVYLHQDSYEKEKVLGIINSRALSLLMQAVEKYCPWQFIEIDSQVVSESQPVSGSDLFKVRRTTVFKVHNVLMP